MNEDNIITKTRTALLWNERRRYFNDLTDKMVAAAKEEFKPGTKVRWIRTFRGGEPQYTHGEVVDVGYGRVKARTRSGVVHGIEAHLVDIMEDT